MAKNYETLKFGRKELMFLIESVEFRLAWYRSEISATDEEATGELQNDAALLEIILTTLKKTLDRWV